MSFLEWRRFSFFDVQNQIDNGKIAECLKDITVTVSTSGHNHVILCDLTGYVHRISRSWEITSFKAYELTVTLAQQLPHEPYLVTVGDDEAGINPLVKVWDWSRVDRHGNPKCVRTSRAVPSHMYPTPATALAVHENKNILAVGFQDGSVMLYRGDITRQRSAKVKTLPGTGTSAITGLAFKGADKLFVVTRSSVLVGVVGGAGEACSPLDGLGAPPGCSVLTDALGLTVAAADAIYCYTTESRGPCYALKGEKVKLNWFRSYLVIITNETLNEASGSSTIPKAHKLTILDIQNKFIVFSKNFDEIDAVLTEWGSFYVLTKKKEMIYLDEKDLQSKLFQLFKKNLYDVAIRIASSQHYDEEGLTEIYKQYGDHLYSKGDFKGAIEQYVKTIGWLETSYVIRKYLEARHVEPLVVYLEALHRARRAADDHTALLLTCYVKIDQHDRGRLREFVNSKDIDFDVDVAIKVVRQVSIEDAISLALTHKRHDWYLRMTVEDLKQYRPALDYIAELDFEAADTYMRTYGHKLIQHAPHETTELLKALCTDYRPRSRPLVDESTLGGGRRVPDRAAPDDYVHVLLAYSERLVDFLAHVVAADPKCSKLVYNALIEHYIHVWSKSSDDDKCKYEEKVLALLKDPDANYDKDQTLIICQMLGFKAGILHIYEERKLWRGQAALHLRAGRAERALELCRRRGGSCPRLWLDVLWAPPPAACLPELLRGAAEENLLSPIQVIDCLASTTLYTLGDVRKYLTDVLKAEEEVINREQELAAKYRGEIEQMKAQIQVIQHEPVTFQNSRCAACKRNLELPTVHFLCQHSFHNYCFETYSEKNECPACDESDKGANRATLAVPDAEQLHARLQADRDPFTVVSEYFGRGLFNKVVVTDAPEPNPPARPAPGPVPQTHAPPPTAPLGYGPGAEAKLRLQEGQSKQVFVSNAAKQMAPKGSSVIPVPEGRMRVMEHQYSSSLEANLNKLDPRPAQALSVASRDESKSISSAITNDSKNPFEENYDESKNPFAEEENDPKNPFADDDDYDKNLNPFT